MSSMRCLFVLPSLRGGGAERVTTLLLQHLQEAGTDVGDSGSAGRRSADPRPVSPCLDLHLALVEKTGPNVPHIPASVTVHDLQAGRVSRAIVPLVRLVRRLQPRIVFSTISHLNLAMAMARWTWPAQTRLILRETATCRQTLSSAASPTLRRALYRRFYRKADVIVCQTPYMLCDLQRHFQIPAAKLRVIPNPVDFAAIEQLKQADPSLWRWSRGQSEEERHPPLPVTAESRLAAEGGPHVVSVGGLRPVKGVQRILSAFPHLLARRPKAHLWLLGDGPCRPSLRRQATDLKIADRVHFVGYQANPYAWLRRADLMVLGSYNESSPNSVLESVACGCPPITTRHPGGTYEMLSHLGLANRFVSRLDRWEDQWFERLPATALERARARYAVEPVAVEYRSLFAQVAVSSSSGLNASSSSS